MFLQVSWQNFAVGLSKVPPRIRFLLLGIAIGIFLLQLGRVSLDQSPEPEFVNDGSNISAHQPSSLSKWDISQAAQNESLGFGKIFYISLPYRTDRQDQMTLLAASTNIKLHLQPGVLGSNVHDKAKPNEATNLRPEQLGCWRSHADVWRRVVEEDIDTAMILEDDADWDINVHEIFQELSVQIRKGKLRKTRASKYERRNAPYGLEWDLLYVGTCWDIPNIDNRPKHQIYDDPFGPNRAETFFLSDQMYEENYLLIRLFRQSGSFVTELEGWGLTVTNDTRQRVIAPSWYPVCTIGYAVTRLGAQKLLYTVGGVKGIGSGIDLTMSDRIQKGILTSYTVVPPMVTPWKTGSTRDSDIDDLKEKQEKENKKLQTGSENLKNSARRALEKRLGTPEKERKAAWFRT